MGTPYSEVMDNFIMMIHEHKLSVLEEYDRDDWVESLMFIACSKFNKVCRKDLTSRDEVNKCFNENLEDKEIDQILNKFYSSNISKQEQNIVTNTKNFDWLNFLFTNPDLKTMYLHQLIRMCTCINNCLNF